MTPRRLTGGNEYDQEQRNPCDYHTATENDSSSPSVKCEVDDRGSWYLHECGNREIQVITSSEARGVP